VGLVAIAWIWRDAVRVSDPRNSAPENVTHVSVANGRRCLGPFDIARPRSALAHERSERFSCEIRASARRRALGASRPVLSEHKLFRALQASLAGLLWALRSERAFRLEAGVLAAAVPAAFILTPDAFRRAELIAVLLIVLAVELLNTAIEKLCDRTTPDFDPAIKAIKDMGSAAVFCVLLMAGAIWIGAVLARFW